MTVLERRPQGGGREGSSPADAGAPTAVAWRKADRKSTVSATHSPSLRTLVWNAISKTRGRCATKAHLKKRLRRLSVLAALDLKKRDKVGSVSG